VDKYERDEEKMKIQYLVQVTVYGKIAETPWTHEPEKDDRTIQFGVSTNQEGFFDCLVYADSNIFTDYKKIGTPVVIHGKLIGIDRDYGNIEVQAEDVGLQDTIKR
jgi:hypothetical protein